MSVEEIITKLMAFPLHFTVDAMVRNEDDDVTEDIVGVDNAAEEKIVHIELAGELAFTNPKEACEDIQLPALADGRLPQSVAAILANVLREHADQIQNHEPRRDSDMDSAELIRVLARLVEGKAMHRSFGAPGDWGYSTPIGKALCGKVTV